VGELQVLESTLIIFGQCNKVYI